MWRCSARRPRARPMDSIHFGFHVEDADVIAGRLKNWDIVGPTDRPREALAAASSRPISQLQDLTAANRAPLQTPSAARESARCRLGSRATARWLSRLSRHRAQAAWP